MADIPAWLKYSNQGATRNDPLAPELINAMSFLGDMGITMDVISGGQEDNGPNGTGSTRHNHGNAADVDFYKDGRKLDWSNPNDLPLLTEIVRTAKGNGITGIGAGDDYMGAGRFHVGFGAPGVWGAGGKGANAPAWLREAYNGAAAATAATGQPHSVNDGHDHSGYASGGATSQPGQSTQPNPDNALRQPELNFAIASNDVNNFLRQPTMAQYQPLAYERRNILGGI